MKMTLRRALGFTVLFLLMPCLLLCLQAADSTNQSTAVELQRLQGQWEGVELGPTLGRTISITITGNSLRFQKAANEWHEGTFTLAAGTNPQQLRFTMKGSSVPELIGEVVLAIFKIEDGGLTLLPLAGDAGEPAKGFEDKESTRYELRKVQPQKKDAQPPKAK
jgi:uncharacterized protein (TIGR03067 family)